MGETPAYPREDAGTVARHWRWLPLFVLWEDVLWKDVLWVDWKAGKAEKGEEMGRKGERGRVRSVGRNT